ncbi:PREDICTED: STRICTOSIDINE SYNTHASE-LIKE [Prunus dulcis]|uniref:PREDICTED: STRICTOSIDINE SYNTHASE-LIKE n=1 Tax=Prunus dulcis TaxID=3755 RepID=A0A5E4FVB9_PRUDU|nr:PREDICTED: STRICTOSIDINE SYNTHASE-LIKE [Prunus dulcis]
MAFLVFYFLKIKFCRGGGIARGASIPREELLAESCPPILTWLGCSISLELLFWVGHHEITGMEDASVASFVSAADVEKLSNHEENKFEVVPIVEGAVGPESFVFDPLGGGPYTGVSDGRIVKWDQDKHHWINFAVTSPNSYASNL